MTVLDVLRQLLARTAPKSAATITAARARAHSHRLIKQWGIDRLNLKLIANLGRDVLEGPFAGLRLTPMCEAEHIGPFLLGVYESEIDEAWATVLGGRYDQIVDVGAKFGYYAAGLARTYPESMVTAFDIDPWARRAMTEMSAANGLSNVQTRGFCDPGWFDEHLTDASLIVSDCEGYETVLFERITSLRLGTATIIVETHDDFVRGSTDRVVAALSSTHVIHRFDGHDRRLSTRDLSFLTEEERRLAQHEVRGNQMWLLCLPSAVPNQHLAATSTRRE